MLNYSRPVALLCGVVGVAALAGLPVFAEQAKGHADGAKVLPSAKVTLQQGLTACESKGQPISAKFEVDEGHFQLSVYTATGGGYQEIVVDHTTGAISKAETSLEADDLKAAVM